MTYYFTIQYRRICRFLIDFGVQPWFGFILGILAFCLLAALVFSRSEFPEVIMILSLMTVLWPLSDVKRNNFLKQLYPSLYLRMRMVENAFLAFPFLVALVITSSWIASAVSFLLAICLVFYNKANVMGLVIPTPFKKAPFEFIVGFRIYILAFIGLYTIAGIGCVVHNYNLSVVCLAMTHLLCTQFYSTMEPVSYVKMYDYNPKRYIHNKCKIAVQHSCIISVLLHISLLLVFPDMWYITIIVWIYSMTCIILTVLLKYASFPNTPGLLDIILTVTSIFFPPFLIIMVVYLYRKSIANLSLYLS